MTTYAPKPEKPHHEGDDDLLQFVISKINRGGHKKTRIVSLQTRSRTLVSCSTSGQKSKTLQIKEITRIERCYDKRKCSVFFANRATVQFTFADAAVRERFLGRLNTLWELALEEKASLQKQTQRPIDPQHIKMIVVTWNVGESLPPPSAILSMCLGEMAEYDLYVVALQECSKKKEQWCTAIKFYLEFGGVPFVVVKEARLWDMVLLILAKESLARLINHVEADHVARGVGDVLGNKGGIGISLCINDTSFCFLNSHLAARAERIPQRQANYMRIVRSLQLGLKSSDILNQFDHVIWAGDLNYRVDADFHKTIEDLQQQRWGDISPYDQLVTEMQKLHVFLGFKEGPLEFAPTYRWDRNTNEISNKREQTPSWTDRILWKSLVAGELIYKNYKSAPDALGSDHRPVFATFDLHPRFPYTGVSLFSNFPDRKHIEIHLTSPVVDFDGDVSNPEKAQFSIILSSYILPQSVSPPALVHLKDQVWGYTDPTTSIELLPFIFDRKTVRKTHITVSLSLVSSFASADTQEGVKSVEDSKVDPKAGLMGCAVISLDRVFDENASFRALITNAGQPVGELRGKFHVVHRGTLGWSAEIPPLKPVRPGGMLSNLFHKTANIFQDANDGVEVNTDTDAANLTHVSFPFHTIKEKWLFFAEEYLTPQKDPGPIAALHGALCCLKDLYCLGGGQWARDIPIHVGLIKATADCGNTSVSMGIAWIYFRNKPDNQALGVMNCGTGGVRLQLYIRSKAAVLCLLEYKPPGGGKGVFSNLRIGNYGPANAAKEQTPEQIKEEIATLLLNAPWNNVKLRTKLAKQFKVRVEKLNIPVVAFVSGTIRNFWENKQTDVKDAENMDNVVNSILESVAGPDAYVSNVLSLEKKSFFIKQRVEGQMELVGCRALYNQFASTRNNNGDKESTNIERQQALEPVVSLGIGKGSSQWTSLYYAQPDAHTHYSLEPSIQFGMDSPELAERLATAIVAQYRPYQEGLRKLMLSVMERGNAPCFALKSGCLLTLDDASRDLKGVSGKLRRKQLVEMPSAVAIPPVNVILFRRSGFSVPYVLSTNSVPVVCADACSLLILPGEDPRPQFLKVNTRGETAFLTDLAGVVAGTELEFSTVHELLGKPMPLPLIPKPKLEKDHSAANDKMTDNMAKSSPPSASTADVKAGPGPDLDLALIGTGRIRRITPAEDPTDFLGKRKGDTPKLDVHALLSTIAAKDKQTRTEEKKPPPIAKRGSANPPQSLLEAREVKAEPKPVTPSKHDRTKQSDDGSAKGSKIRTLSHKFQDEILPLESHDDGISPPDAAISPPNAKVNPKNRRRVPDNVDMYDVYRLDP